MTSAPKAGRRGRPALLRTAVVAVAVLLAASVARTQSFEPGLTLFAGTAEGLWRSGDWGRSWSRLAEARPAAPLLELGAARAILALGPQVWAGGDGGVFFSEDWGDSWTRLSSTPGVSVVLPSRWPLSDPTVFVGTNAGLLRSRDGGRTLEPTSLPCDRVRRLDWPGPALAVACSGGFFTTTDVGEHFSGPGRGLPDAPILAMVISSYFANDPVAFVAPRSGGVFRSSDGGRTWSSVGLADERVHDLVWIGRFLYAAAEAGLYRSLDAGASWARLSASPGRPTRLLFPRGGIEGFLATDRGVFHTPDAGEHWEPSGLAGESVLEIATFPAPEAPTRKRKR